nr:MAG TPA: hypothetical protein [Caudoviricetes sp.]
MKMETKNSMYHLKQCLRLIGYRVYWYLKSIKR